MQALLTYLVSVYLLLPLVPERTPFLQKNQEEEAKNMQLHISALAEGMKSIGIPRMFMLSYEWAYLAKPV